MAKSSIPQTNDYSFLNALPSTQTRRNMFAVLIASISLLLVADPEAYAQIGKKPVTKKGNAPLKNPPKPEVDAPEPDLQNIDIDAVPELEDHSVTDPDETPEGKARLNEITDRAKTLYVDYWARIQERRPIASPRDVLVGQIHELYDGISNAQNEISIRSDRIAMLNNLILLDNNNNALKQERNNLNGQVQQLNGAIASNQAAIQNRIPQVTAYNNQLQPIDERLRKLWEEVNACRKQWLEIRVPQEKYARAEFENLKRVIDEWARVDGLWPQMFCWGALCEFELGQYDTAMELVEKADKMRIEVFHSKKKWPHVEAMWALVCTKHSHLKPKFDEYVKSALVSSDRKVDWETPFIVGLAMSNKMGQSKRAEGFLKQSLNLKPSSMTVNYHLAVLQIRGEPPTLNISEGTKQLETLWIKTGKRSWRIAFELARAYQATERRDEAKAQLEVALKLAPTAEHERIRAIFMKI